MSNRQDRLPGLRDRAIARARELARSMSHTPGWVDVLASWYADGAAWAVGTESKSRGTLRRAIRERELEHLSACAEADELRAALREALCALSAINMNRHAPETPEQRAAVAELERVIAVCQGALS